MANEMVPCGPPVIGEEYGDSYIYPMDSGSPLPSCSGWKSSVIAQAILVSMNLQLWCQIKILQPFCVLDSGAGWGHH